VGQTNHGRFRREELQREVIGAIRQGIDFIRNPLHREMWVKGQRRVVEEDAESLRRVMEKLQEGEGSGGKVRVGQVIGRDLSSRSSYPLPHGWELQRNLHIRKRRQIGLGNRDVSDWSDGQYSKKIHVLGSTLQNIAY
jgi:hypothetical protein